MYEERALDVFQRHDQYVPFDVMFEIVEDEIAVAVGKRDFEAGFDEQTGSPARVFLRSGGRADVERRPFGIGVGSRKIRVSRDVTAPIDVLKTSLFVYAEDVGTLVRIDNEYLGTVEEANGGTVLSGREYRKRSDEQEQQQM